MRGKKCLRGLVALKLVLAMMLAAFPFSLSAGVPGITGIAPAPPFIIEPARITGGSETFEVVTAGIYTFSIMGAWGRPLDPQDFFEVRDSGNVVVPIHSSSLGSAEFITTAHISFDLQVGIHTITWGDLRPLELGAHALRMFQGDSSSPPQNHTITISTQGNVNAWRLHTYAIFTNIAWAGERVTITANSNIAAGYFFSHWEVVSGGAVLDNINSPTTWFIMPASPVEVRAVAMFDSTALTLTAVSNDPAWGIALANVDTNFVSDFGTIQAVPASGYAFVGWNQLYGTTQPLTYNPPFADFAFFLWPPVDSLGFEAEFRPMVNPRTITTTVNNPTWGSAFSSLTLVETGDRVMLQASRHLGVPATIQFSHWEAIDPSGLIIHNANQQQGAYFYAPDTNVVVEAVFIDTAAPPLTFTISPSTISLSDTTLTDDVTASGTATGNITFNRGTLPAGVNLTASGNTITATATRPAYGQPDLTGSHNVQVIRNGFTQTLTIMLNVTALTQPPPPTFTINPATITLDDTTLSQIVTAAGTATGAITFDRGTLPAAVSLTVSDNTITATATRPAYGQPELTGTHAVTVTRGGIPQTLNITLNLTPLTQAPTPTFTISPTTVTLNDTTLSQALTAGGTATGAITLDRGTLPAAVGLTATGNTITVTATRPAAGQPALTGTHVVTATRGGINQQFSVTLNVTALQPQPVLPTGGVHFPNTFWGDGWTWPQPILHQPTALHVQAVRHAAPAGATFRAEWLLNTAVQSTTPFAIGASGFNTAVLNLNFANFTHTGNWQLRVVTLVDGVETFADTSSIFPLQVFSSYWWPNAPHFPHFPNFPAQTPATTPEPAPEPFVPPSLWVGPLPLAFDDINPNEWFAGYVAAVTSAGLFQGVGDRQFSPSLNMTRAMFVQTLANLDGVNLAALGGRTPRYNDVAAGAWYFGAVEWASALGLNANISGANFQPNAPITREQIAVMLYRYINAMALNTGVHAAANVPFADQGTISPWAVNAVNAVRAAGIVTGRADGTFDPHATATRAEVAAIFARLVYLTR